MTDTAPNLARGRGANFEEMRRLASKIGLCALPCWVDLWNGGYDPCVSTRPGSPYVSTNPNYVCESLETFVYINVAQGYANPSDAQRTTSTLAGTPLTYSRNGDLKLRDHL